MSELIRSWDKRIGYSIIRTISRWLSVSIFDFRAFGREHIPTTGGALLLSTHQSNLDPVLVGLCSNRRLNYLARKSLFKSRLFAALIRFLDAIAIDREGGGLEGIRETIARLKRGEFVLLFPEGTRTSTGSPAPLKNGFLAIAKRSKVPLIPVAIVGAYQVLPKGSKYPCRHPIVVLFGKPIAYDEIASLEEGEILCLVAERLNELHHRGLASMRD